MKRIWNKTSEVSQPIGLGISGVFWKSLAILIILCFAFLSHSLEGWGQSIRFTLDFETGDLRGWTRTGNAFNYQPP